MTIPKLWLTIGALVVAVLVSVLVFRSCGGEARPIITKATQALDDSLKQTRLADSLARAKFQVEKDSLRRVADSLRLLGESKAVSSYYFREIARARADSARSARTLKDSARLFELAYAAEKSRGDSLDAALAFERSANNRLLRALALSDSAAIDSDKRRAAIERLNASLKNDIARAQRGDCYLIGSLKCPSRTVALVSGVVIGGAIAYTVTSSKRDIIIASPRRGAIGIAPLR